ncbi:toxin [Streptomyces cavernicola]|uniref:Toxin n=1 Tax=Streptomyces cavernicola TaxID=3043613 RepID=A0ABT6SCY6_9ACTN|nr:toxin [Streptomyces sp. B-S-A6]MDI3405825.1 toxin [Streptomyces sp. B-S-A6]
MRFRARRGEPGPDAVRLSCRDFVRDLRLPAVAGVRDLVPYVEQRTGRALRLEPAEVAASESVPCGMWLATRDTHYVFYDPRTSRSHQDHIIAHEFGHILKEHRGGPALRDKDAAALITHIDPAVVRAVLGRTDYAEHDEREAELIGSYLQAHASAHTSPYASPYEGPFAPSAPADQDAARVARTLLRPRGAGPGREGRAR